MKSLPKYLWGIFTLGESKPDWHQKELQLREFLKGHSEDEEAILHQWSIVLGFQDKYDECIKIFERMLELDPDVEMKLEIYMALGRNGTISALKKGFKFLKPFLFRTEGGNRTHTPCDTRF